MNSPKEKAEELYSKMYGKTPVRVVIAEREKNKQLAKQCAIIAVDEIIKETDSYYDTLIASERKLYWQQVKKEIENL